MDAAEIADVLTESTSLEGPHWFEPVRVLTARSHDRRIEAQLFGTLAKNLLRNLLNPDEFGGGTDTVTAGGKLPALDAPFPAAEAHRIELAIQYDPHFSVIVSQVDPLRHPMDTASVSSRRVVHHLGNLRNENARILEAAPFFDSDPLTIRRACDAVQCRNKSSKPLMFSFPH